MAGMTICANSSSRSLAITNYLLAETACFSAVSPGWVDYLIGGYQLSTSLNFSSGLPFTPSYGECGTDIPANPCMPNKTSARLPLRLTSFSTATHSRTYFIPGLPFGANGSQSGVFTRPNIGQFGNVGRNNYFGPTFFADDLSLLKNIPIHESIVGNFASMRSMVLTIFPQAIQTVHVSTAQPPAATV